MNLPTAALALEGSLLGLLFFFVFFFLFVVGANGHSPIAVCHGPLFGDRVLWGGVGFWFFWFFFCFKGDYILCK